MPIDDPAFLDRPQVLISAENPAYDADISLVFSDDLQAIAENEGEFQNIEYLSRPHFERRPGEGVRVSRLGQRRGTINTRSGVNIGSSHHFYFDISDISYAETIEMDFLGEQSGESTIVRGPERTMQRLTLQYLKIMQLMKKHFWMS